MAVAPASVAVFGCVAVRVVVRLGGSGRMDMIVRIDVDVLVDFPVGISVKMPLSPSVRAT